MSLTWTQAIAKTQRQARDNGADTLVQLKEDWNQGYHLFNAENARYYSRRQQFCDLVQGQRIYQTPVNCVKISGMTLLMSAGYEPPLFEVRTETEWRQKLSIPQYASNLVTHYFAIGKESFGLYPLPSQDVTNGLRIWYQPEDSDMSIDDTTSPTVTVTLTENSPTVTASGAIFTQSMIGQSFRPEGVVDLTWYEITAVPSATELTLGAAYIGPSASGLSWRVGQIPIIPQQFQDSPMHYALANYFSTHGDETRGQYHRGLFENMIKDCKEQYSSSSTSNVLTEGDEAILSAWYLTPQPGV